KAKQVTVGTYAPTQGWQSYGGAIAVQLASGDQLGARAYANGAVEVLRNGGRIGTTSVTAWPFYAQTGRVGLTLSGTTRTRIDDFGGGSITANRAPVAVANASPTTGPAPLSVQF